MKSINENIFQTNFSDNTTIILHQESEQTFLVLKSSAPKYDVTVTNNANIPVMINNTLLHKYENTIYNIINIDEFSILVSKPDDIFDGTANIQIKLSLNDVEYSNYNIKILYKFDNNISLKSKKSENKIYENISSYMLARTNPLLSGNIKLRVDEKQHMFLDTFKVSDVLSKKEVRRQEVSASGIYSDDIRRVFSKIPSSEIFKLNKYNTLDVSSPKQDVRQQYDTEYIYGARHLKDELYNESFSIFAPLWINSSLPDYFVVFKVPGVYNPESYDNKDMSTLLNKFIREGEIIKSWNLNNNFPLGKYIKKHMDEINTFEYNVFLSMNESEPNKWCGVSINDGIIAQLNELPYDFNNLSNFTDVNNYVSTGFMRNNIIIPNIVNLEFIFDDENAREGEMNRYFGLYLTHNDIVSYNIHKDTKINILNTSDNIDKISNDIFLNNDILDKYKDRILCMRNNTSIKQIKHKSDVIKPDDMFINNKKDESFTTQINKIKRCNFLSLTLTDVIPAGYHLSLYKHDESYESIYVSDIALYEKDEIGEHVKYHQTSTHTNKLVNISSHASLNEQKNAIYDALMYLTDDKLKVRIVNNTINIYDISNEYDKIEIVTNRPLLSTTYDDVKDPFYFYTDYNFDIDDYTYKTIELFECFGDRETYCVKFANMSNCVSLNKKFINKLTNTLITKGTNVDYVKLEPTNIDDKLYYVNDPDNSDNIIIRFNHEPFTLRSYMTFHYLESVKISIMGIIPIKDFYFTVNDKELSQSFKSEYWYNRVNDADVNKLTLQKNDVIKLQQNKRYEIISGSGYFNKENENNKIHFNTITSDDNKYINTYFDDIYLTALSEVKLSLAQKDTSTTFLGFDDTYNEEYIRNYYNADNLKELKYGLTTPYICKWNMLGSDCRSNNLRLFLDEAAFASGPRLKSNFIPYSSNNGELFTDEIIYPTHKFLNKNAYDTISYVYLDINELITIDSNKKETLKNILLDKKYVGLDLFSKLFFNKYEDAIKKPTLLKYNKYFNSLETIFLGNKLSFTLNNDSIPDINIESYNNFRFCAILTNTQNTTSNKQFEIIINEKNKYVILVWYQKSSELTYSRRYSVNITNKNILDDTNENMFKKFSEGEIYNYIKRNVLFDTSKPLFKLAEYNTLQVPVNEFKNYVQISNDRTDYNSIFTVFDKSSIEGTLLNFSNDKQYNTFEDKFVIGDININKHTYGKNIINESYTYNTDTNIYANSTANLKSFKDIENSYNINTYIHTNNRLISSNNFINESILNVKILDPVQYKNDGIITHNGWYLPMFKDIVLFSFDDEIENVLELDLNLCNTKINKVLNIEQFWYNKLKHTLNDDDFIINEHNILTNKIGYKELNPCSSIWDRNYYSVLNENNDEMYINGYKSPVELPSMFGSKLLKLKNSITLNAFNNSTLTYKRVKNTYYSELNSSYVYEIKYNLTDALIKYFSDIQVFVNNWDKLTSDEQNTSTIISEYIKQTVLTYYNLSLYNIKTNVFKTNYKDDVISYDNITENTENVLNIKSDILEDNNNIIYKLYVPYNKEHTYFCNFTINEI